MFWCIVLLHVALIVRALLAAASYIIIHGDLFGPRRPMADRRRFDASFATLGFVGSIGSHTCAPHE